MLVEDLLALQEALEEEEDKKAAGHTPAGPAAAKWHPPDVVDGRPLRILCLHGTCSSSFVMKKQVSRLQPQLKGKAELIFVDGHLPVEDDNPMLEEQLKFFATQKKEDFKSYADWVKQELNTQDDIDLKAELEKRYPDPGEFYAYLQAHPAERGRIAPVRQYQDVEAALDVLQGHLRSNAPVDGVLGFSQGANFASLLAAQAVAGQGENFSFVVHLCPARPGWVGQKPELFKEPLPMRSLHISGDRDFLNPPLPLVPLYEEAGRVSMMHEDGHRPIPGTSMAEANRIAKAIVDFILLKQ